MSILPLSTDLSYSSSYQGNLKQKPKISREEMREYMKALKTFPEIKEEHPNLTMSIYNRLLDKFGFPRDTVRVQLKRSKSMMAMYNANVPIDEIAKAHGISAKTCQHYFNDMGVSCSKVALIERDKEAIKAAIESSATRKELAKKISVGQRAAQKIMDDLEVQTERGRKKEFIESLKRSTVQGWIDTYKTVKNISENVKLSASTVRKYIKFFGLHI